MPDFFRHKINVFAAGVFPDWHRRCEEWKKRREDEFDYIYCESEDEAREAYPHLTDGGIIAGEGKTAMFGADVLFVNNKWLHVKPASGVFPFRPVIITLNHTEQALKEMDKWGISYSWHPGVRHTSGHIGCAKAYMSLFEKYKGDVMVFEDDIKFMRNPHTLDVSDIANNYDAIYFGANIKDLCERVKPELSHKYSRLMGAWTTHAVLYSSHLIEKIKKEFDPERGVPIDEWLRRQMPEGRFYVCKPFYATQQDGYSLIMNTRVNYSIIFNSQNLLT